MTIQITKTPAGAGAACASILADLPQWFGIAESNATYAELAERDGAWLVTEGADPQAIMILKTHGLDAVEIYLLAVRPACHHGGLGRALVEQGAAIARDRGARYLTVKTLGPSAKYEPYERTRAFYVAMGFVALEELPTLWGPQDPCLFMVKALDVVGGSPHT